MQEKRGRPKDPNAVRNQPRVIMSMPPRARKAIEYLCEHQNYTRSELLQAALLVYVGQLPLKHRTYVSGMLRGLQPKDPGLTCVDVPVDAKPAVEAFVQLWCKPKDSHELAARRFFREFMNLPEDE